MGDRIHDNPGRTFAAGEAVTAANGELKFYHVWVKSGTYEPTEGAGQEATTLLRENVYLYGGFSSTSETFELRDPAANQTIIHGAVFHVVTGADDAVINGFTISGGRAKSIETDMRYSGAGMFNDNVSPRVEDCIFSDNIAGLAGGGMYNTGSAAPVVIGCTFTGNDSESGQGGAVAGDGSSAPTFVDCVFSENDASAPYDSGGSGGAIHSVENSRISIDRCMFSVNAAGSAGGAIFSSSSGTLTIKDSQFTGNSTHGSYGSPSGGGAIYLGDTSATIERCIFSANSEEGTSVGKGGALNASNANLVVTSSVFRENFASANTNSKEAQGGAVRAENGTFRAVNCTFYSNTAVNVRHLIAAVTSIVGGSRRDANARTERPRDGVSPPVDTEFEKQQPKIGGARVNAYVKWISKTSPVSL